MKTAEIRIFDKDNAPDSLKRIVGDSVLSFFILKECTNEELFKIVEYKSWHFKSWKAGTAKQYFVYSYSNSPENKIVYCQYGFSPILVRYLQNYLDYTIIGKELFDSKSIHLPVGKFKMWDFQEEAIRSWWDCGKYGIIKAPTASGKGHIGAEIIRRIGKKTIILVHTSDLLLNVWYNYLVEIYGEQIRNQIGMIGGGLTEKDRKIMRIVGGGFEENIAKDIVIATQQSLMTNLHKLGKQRFGLIIYDEIHHAPAEHFRKVVNVIGAPARLGLSASLHRPDGMSPMMNGLIGGIAYKIGIKELAKKGLLIEPTFKSIIIDDTESVQKIKGTNLKLLEYVKFIKKVSAGSTKKFNYIINLCLKLRNEGRKVLLYTDFVTKEEGIYTRDDYVTALRAVDIRCEGMESKMSALQREDIFDSLKKNQTDVIVFGAMGNEGINIPIVSAIIMTNATASNIKFVQRTGRAMRRHPGKKECIVYEILLNTYKELTWSRESFFEYAEEGFTKEIIRIN